MTLMEIKIKALSKGFNMSEIAKLIGCSRTWMYKKIKENDRKTIQNIKKILDI